MEQTPQPSAQQAEMSLRDLLLRLREYTQEIKRNWWVLILTTVPLVAWQGYVAITTPVQYDAGLTFMVDEESSSGSGMVGALLGDIGLGSPENNYDKILELAKSQRIIRMALFRKVEIDGVNDYLANHLIRIQQIEQEEWSKGEGASALAGFKFTRDSFDHYNRIEYAAFKSLYGILLGDNDHKALFTNRYNQDSGIMSFKLTTRSETLSIVLLKTIFQELSDYYIISSTIKEKATYDIIQGKADSIHRLLAGAETSQARFQDRNYGLLLSQDKVPTERYARNKVMYNIMYAEALKNLEIADYALKDRMPYIQSIDEPIPPLSGYGYGKKKALLLGLGLGLILGIGFIVLRKIIRTQLAGM